ncbi:hypothetical protein F2Q69_00006975 [Brassica cretica]|uniref:Uncharacterized protein n=1 Tax=Brassica cretica TaxID=69181 RepID=A0A8S9P9J2_BRACR|nr:hypothetical protein F2Q69_00006975 [Brassica cretica]
MEGSPYQKFSFSRGKGAVSRFGPEELRSWEPGFLLAGTQRHVSCLGSGGIQYLSIFPQQFSPYCSILPSNSGITCALKSTGVVHSQQASLGQDIAPVILRSRVHSPQKHTLNPEEDQFPYFRPGSGAIEPLVSCWRWGRSGLLMYVLETMEPGALMFPEEELYVLMCRG